jgi:hypothetical protein
MLIVSAGRRRFRKKLKKMLTSSPSNISDRKCYYTRSIKKLVHKQVIPVFIMRVNLCIHLPSYFPSCLCLFLYFSIRLYVFYSINYLIFLQMRGRFLSCSSEVNLVM